MSKRIIAIGDTTTITYMRDGRLYRARVRPLPSTRTDATIARADAACSSIKVQIRRLKRKHDQCDD